MSTNTANETVSWEQRALSFERGWLLSGAITSILIGIFLLFRPEAGVLTIAVVFGLYLVFAGSSRFAFAVTGRGKSGLRRVLGAILGVLVVAAGFYALLNVATSLVLLAITLGIGLIVSGVADLINSGANRERPTWIRVTGGIISVLAGLALLFAPLVSVSFIVWIGAIALILIGVVSIAAMPRDEAS
jgi:uncharacterized membrane protein HdeD (DUF308 family)